MSSRKGPSDTYLPTYLPALQDKEEAEMKKINVLPTYVYTLPTYLPAFQDKEET
jgi:hypothetical protein